MSTTIYDCGCAVSGDGFYRCAEHARPPAVAPDAISQAAEPNCKNCGWPKSLHRPGGDSGTCVCTNFTPYLTVAPEPPPCAQCGTTISADGDWYRLCGPCRWAGQRLTDEELEAIAEACEYVADDRDYCAESAGESLVVLAKKLQAMKGK